MNDLPDVQSEEIDSVPINVGVEGVRKYISVSRRGIRYAYPIYIKSYIMLPHNVRGGNLSRFIESVHHVPEVVNSLEDLAYELACENKRRHNYDCVTNVQADIPIDMMWDDEYETQIFKVYAAYNTSTRRFKLEIELHGMANCPCAKACTASGISHNQNSRMMVSMSYDEDVVESIELDMIAKKLTKAFSAPLRYKLKRHTEAKLIEQASDNSKFVEDIVRDAYDILKRLYKDTGMFVRIKVTNYESIHPHNVVATIQQTL